MGNRKRRKKGNKEKKKFWETAMHISLIFILYKKKCPWLLDVIQSSLIYTSNCLNSN